MSNTTFPRILVLEDDPTILHILRTYLNSMDVEFLPALSCSEARNLLRDHHPIAVVLSDEHLPDGSGTEFLAETRTLFPSTVRILMTGDSDPALPLSAINRGECYRFLTKPIEKETLINAVELAIDRHKLQSENAELQTRLAMQNEELRRANELLSVKIAEQKRMSTGLIEQSSDWRNACSSLIDLLLEMMHRFDPDLARHCQHVARLSTAIARDMNHDEDFINRLEVAALMHDLGLFHVQPNIKLLQRNLDAVEEDHTRDLLRNHPETSASLLHFLPTPAAIEAIRQHHEYHDGSGYPLGLGGDRISPMAAILIVADNYDEHPEEPSQALAHIEAGAGTRYHGEVVRSLERLVHKNHFRPVKERPLLIDELKPGMELSSSIYTATGMLLVRQDQILTEPIIRSLVQHNNANNIAQTIYIKNPL